VVATNLQIVASDGGYRSTPTEFPAGGLYMGVGERYEVVCNLASYKGKTLYLWNSRDDRFKDVPYFCFSHLVMRIDVARDAKSGGGAK
jgi:FtsP/CotA-like multicopper oxidase with cupredoxin domain